MGYQPLLQDEYQHFDARITKLKEWMDEHSVPKWEYDFVEQMYNAFAAYEERTSCSPKQQKFINDLYAKYIEGDEL